MTLSEKEKQAILNWIDGELYGRTHPEPDKRLLLVLMAKLKRKEDRW